ncbi:GDP-mannose 4,6-dehydratase [Methanobacterium spitsbergense]|uniref:GDP-mannose 4,6-dehydratase n=1 Tax=Methanobacterium spitsbergense TaxID=2874285 RepID=A0A8T5URT1_9EURY|nr:GDP-mannose 4,6-dehydratase [Methanobacterium spitsbergense]MBZ2166394.1 GDP-mannose 4,6-dehydratase [Methanobacterium spitsbergense]
MSWNDKNILITGADGFVGSYLAEELLKNGSDVYGLIQRGTGDLYSKNLTDHGLEKDLKIIEGDLTDITSLANALDESEPDYVFHLAAQSFVPASFKNPLATQMINGIGTANLLDAIRIKEYNPKIIFAGSSEEYGMIITSKEQYDHLKAQYKNIFPKPEEIPELPIKETNPLRPMSPYATSKVYGDFLMRNYFNSFGLNTIVSRAFNHEGAGRGLMFVTSVITDQVAKLKSGQINRIKIGNLNSFKDWSHVKDIIMGYMKLALNGKSGDVYNQGSMRTNSVLSYILLSLEQAGYNINMIETFKGEKKVSNPTEIDTNPIFGVKFDKTLVDRKMLEEDLEYSIKDKGINVLTDHGKIAVEFNPERFRPAEVPIMLADTRKIQKIGAKTDYSIKDIINDQLNYLNK